MSKKHFDTVIIIIICYTMALIQFTRENQVKIGSCYNIWTRIVSRMEKSNIKKITQLFYLV